MSGATWLWLAGGIVILVLLVARAVRQPDQPRFKWTVPASWIGVVAGVFVDLGILWIVAIVAFAASMLWDRAWRLGEGESTFF